MVIIPIPMDIDPLCCFSKSHFAHVTAHYQSLVLPAYVLFSNSIIYPHTRVPI